MKFSVIFCAASLSVADIATAESWNPKYVVAKASKWAIRGVEVRHGVYGFLGIPYAQPPIGNLRFRPPQPLDMASTQNKSSGLIEATKFGPVCYQFMYKSVIGNQSKPAAPESEDCLNLNVYVPAHQVRHSIKLPVFVWSYGGGFAEGGNSVPIYDPSDFVAQSKDIIVVTWNYRLSVFGFPNSPALKEQNLGIRDQRAALEWIRDNIAAFGGDPKRIVLGGQSAGADTAHAMIYSHPRDPIMAGLLLQSGTIQVANAGSHQADAEFVRIAKTVGCADDDRHQELQCMQDADPIALKHAISNITLNKFGSPTGGVPMVDNITIFTLSEYAKRGQSGDFAHIPMLLGSTSGEGQGVINWQTEKGINQTFARIITETIFACNMLLNGGFHATHNIPVWRYWFRGVFPEVTTYPWLGAYHGADVPLLMGTYKQVAAGRRGKTTAQASHLLQEIFASFIRNPRRGLLSDFGMPTFRPHTSSLIELFRNNTATYKIMTPTVDAVCKNPTPVPYEEWDKL